MSRETELEFTGTVRELAQQARALEEQIEEIGEPPTPAQLKAVQEGLDRIQRKLNSLQTEVDAWTEETHV